MSMKDLDIINSALALPKACLSLQDEANGHIWGGETYHVTLKLKALKIQTKWKSCIIPSFGYMNSSNWTKGSKRPKYNVTHDKSKHFKCRMVTSIASAAIYNLTVLLSEEDIQMKTTAILCRYRREILLVLFEFPRGKGVCTPRKQCKTKVTHKGPGSKLLDSLGPRKIRLTSWECHIGYIKWTRTDTILDLSQKANKGEKNNRMVLDQQLKMKWGS